jgi:hypothetical protein
MRHLDGNVLAGPTADIFAFEVTTTPAQCGACADIATLGQAMVYGEHMGYVVRCRKCDNVLMVIVERAGLRYLNLRGLRWVQVAERTIINDITAPSA